MIWFIITLLLALWLAFYLWRNLDEPFAYGHVWRAKLYVTFWVGILIVGMLVSAAIPTSVFVSKGITNESMRPQLVEIAHQRDELLATFDKVLSNEDFERLSEAVRPEDVKFLATQPGVSQFLLGRADRIVDANQRLYTIRNNVLSEARGICAYVKNPLAPRIPFVGPNCNYKDILKESG